MDDRDGFDGEVPEELQAWFDSQESDRGLQHYIFVNGKIKRASMLEWVQWFSNFENRKVDRTDIEEGVFVSTVCLGLDHNFDFESWKEHKPILFETMVMGGPFSDMGWRYASWGEAKRGHWHVVDCIRSGRRPDVPFGERPWMELFLEMFDAREQDEPGSGEGDASSPGEPEELD